MLKASILLHFVVVRHFFGWLGFVFVNFYLGRESHGGLGKNEKLIYLLLYITEPTLRPELCMTGVKSITCA